MKRVFRLVLVISMLTPLAALAQQSPSNFSIVPFFGYRFGGEIEDEVEYQNELITDIELDEDVSYGVGAYWGASRNSELGIRWSHNPSALTYQPFTGERLTAFDLTVDTIHGEFLIGGNRGAKNWGYVILGLGATILSPDGDFQSETQFSGTLGGGFRMGITPNVGLRLEGRWLPVYLYSTDDGGYWCDPFFGCYVVTNDTFLTQFEAAAGIEIRF